MEEFHENELGIHVFLDCADKGTETLIMMMLFLLKGSILGGHEIELKTTIKNLALAEKEKLIIQRGKK